MLAAFVVKRIAWAKFDQADETRAIDSLSLISRRDKRSQREAAENCILAESLRSRGSDRRRNRFPCFRSRSGEAEFPFLLRALAVPQLLGQAAAFEDCR